MNILHQRLSAIGDLPDNQVWGLVRTLLDEALNGAPFTRAEVLMEFGYIAPFYEDSEHQKLAKLARRTLRITSGKALIEKLLAEHDGKPEGVELRNRTGSLFAVLLPDASSPGKVRASLFDENGFFSHITRADYREVLKEIVEDGYRYPAPGALERCFAKESFNKWQRVRH